MIWKIIFDPPIVRNHFYFTSADLKGKMIWFEKNSLIQKIVIAETEYGIEPGLTNKDNKCPVCDKLQSPIAIYCKNCGADISPKKMVTKNYCDKCKTEYDQTCSIDKMNAMIFIISEY